MNKKYIIQVWLESSLEWIDQEIIDRNHLMFPDWEKTLNFYQYSFPNSLYRVILRQDAVIFPSR